MPGTTPKLLRPDTVDLDSGHTFLQSFSLCRLTKKITFKWLLKCVIIMPYSRITFNINITLYILTITQTDWLGLMLKLQYYNKLSL